MVATASSDAELVRRFQAGDEDAYVEIVTRYRAKVFAIALRYLRNPADAEEIAQDAFVRAHRSLAGFRGESSLATWLHCIVRNLSRNRYKHYASRRHYDTVSFDSAFDDNSRATFYDMIASEAPSPAREATSGEFSILVAECMGKLRANQRQVLLLRNGLNDSYDDIARTLGISIGTVKSRIGRARESLRLLLAESYPDAAPGAPPLHWFESIRSDRPIGVPCV